MDSKTIRERKYALNTKRFPSEIWFERHLTEAKIKGYRRNVCLECRFFGDFVFNKSKLVIEIDGASHSGKRDYDKSRDTLLKHFGYTVIRVRYNNSKDLAKALSFVKANRSITPKISHPEIRAQKKSKKQIMRMQNQQKIMQYEKDKERHEQVIANRKAQPKFIIRKKL
jgi:very-short-patch-repair endonuclease